MTALYRALILLAATSTAAAQGFDWQPSPRRPYQAPTTFYGLDAGVALGMHSGTLPYLENDVASPCCTYDQGSGIPIRIGLSAEVWVTPTRSVALDVGLQTQSTGFLAPEQSLPRVGRDPLITRYELDVQTSYVSIGGTVRQRLGSTMLTAAAGVRSGILLQASMTNREVVLGPMNETFASGRREEVLPTVGLVDASWLVVEPFVGIGYDMPLALGYYLQPTLTLSYTVTSVSSLHPWRYSALGLGVRLMKGR